MPIKNVPNYIVTIDNFSTLARKTTGELIVPTIGFDAQNLRFDETYGSIVKRKDRSNYASMTIFGTAKVTGLYRYYKNSTNTKYLLAAYSTFLKDGDDTAGTWSNIQTGLSAGLKYNWLTYKDLCYAFNGVNSNQVYTGANTCDTMGVPVPVAPTMTKANTGLTGNYYYKVSYEIDGYQEGNASVSSAVIAPSNEAVTVTVPLGTFAIAANYRVTKRILYRTVAGGSIFYRHVAGTTALADTTTATYVDTTADASLDTTITAPTDYGAPASYKYACLHKSRVFLARNATYKSRIIFSDIRSGIAYPDVFPANNYYDILKDNGEELVFVGEDNFGQLIVMKPSAIIKINTDTDDPVGWSGMQSVISNNGCIAPASVAKTSIGLIYLSRFGEFKKRLMVWNGASAQPVFEELEPILSGIFDSRLPDVVGHYHNGAYYLSYNDDTDGTVYNNKVLIIDLITGSWTIDKKNVACFSSWNSGTDWGELYTGSSDTTGLVVREDSDIATQSDTVIDLESELDDQTAGNARVVTQTIASGGTEAAPTLKITSQANLDDDWGASIVSTMTTGTVADLDSLEDNETVAPSGTYISPAYLVNAKTLGSISWTEIVGTNGYVRFWVRTGSTIALCNAASWNGPYDGGSADISAVTADVYVQYMCKLYVLASDTANFADTYLMIGAGDNAFVVKITYGYGTAAETAIELIYTSQWLDFSWVSQSFKRLRKRIRAVKVVYETTVNETLVFGYQVDGSTTRIDVSLDLLATQEFVVYAFPLGVYPNTLKFRLYENSANNLKIKKIIFTVSSEPYHPNL